MKIAFHPMGGASWSFGPIFLKTLFYAVRQTAQSNIALALQLVSSDQSYQPYMEAIQPDEVISYHPLRRWSPGWLVNVSLRQLFSRDRHLENSLARHHVDALFTMGLSAWFPKLATLAWIPDFQHLHLPEMFTATELKSRDVGFRQTVRFATRVIVMTQAVKKDLEEFAPECRTKIRIVRPVTWVSPEIYTRDPKFFLAQYHLPEKFIYLPNQFWQHKNHQLVFSALKLLNERGIRIKLVCSGKPFDYRNPNYFGELWRTLSEWGLHDQVIYLGAVPHEQVLQLIRQCVCVLNPSLFEGWGASADEARSVGKQVLLSDIPPHREQNPSCATFFDLNSVEDLADKLAAIWSNSAPGPALQLEATARRELPARLVAYGNEFLAVASEAIQFTRRQAN